MKKAQASSTPIAKTTSKQLSGFVKELITFPGYAAILFGWLSVAGIAVFKLAWLLTEKQTTSVSVPPADTPVAATSSVPEFVAVVLGVLVILLLVGAIWIYVSKWTKQGIAWLARVFKIKDRSYWAFCIVLLMIGWLALSLLVFATSDDTYLSAVLFASAAAIALGSFSFGLASAWGLDTAAAKTQSFDISFSNADKVKDKQPRQAKKAPSRKKPKKQTKKSTPKT